MAGLPVADADTEIGNDDPVTANSLDFVVRYVSSDRYTFIPVQSTAVVVSLLVRPMENEMSTAVAVSIVYDAGSVTIKLLASAPRSENHKHKITCLG